MKLESARRHKEHLMHPETLGSTSSRATVRLGSMRDQFAQQGRGVCYATLKAVILTPLDEFARWATKRGFQHAPQTIGTSGPALTPDEAKAETVNPSRGVSPAGE